MTKAGRRRERRSERGAAAVEFALIAPFLVFLLFAIIGVGFMLSFRQALSQAAAEGARAAAVAPGGVPATTGPDNKAKRATEAVNQALASYGVTCANGNLIRNDKTAGTCAITLDTTCSGTTVSAKCARVALDYLYKDNSLLPSVPGLGIVLPGSMKYTVEVEVS